MAKPVHNATEVHVTQTSTGDLCASHIILEDEKESIMVVVYNSSDKQINDLILFLHKIFFPYIHRDKIIKKINTCEF